MSTTSVETAAKLRAQTKGFRGTTIEAVTAAFLGRTSGESLRERIESRLPVRLPGASEDECLNMLANAALERELADLRQEVVVRHLRGLGVTWAKIGAALGMTRQGAWQRYGWVEDEE